MNLLMLFSRSIVNTFQVAPQKKTCHCLTYSEAKAGLVEYQQ